MLDEMLYMEMSDYESPSELKMEIQLNCISGDSGAQTSGQNKFCESIPWHYSSVFNKIS